MRLSSLAMIGAPIVLWCFAVAVSDPTGNFPLNDDWSFALTVRHLLDTGGFRPVGWTAMTLLGQTLWGAAFCLLFGYSFETLRAATVVSALIGLLCFSLLLRRLGCDRWTATIASAALGFNPLFFSLAQTFMTDVEFTSVAIASTLFFCRYLQTRKPSAMLWSLLCMFVALSIRQLALYLPIAMLITLLLEGRRDRRGITLSAAGIVAGAAMFKGFELWLASRHATPAAYSLPYEALRTTLLSARTFATKFEQNFRGVLVYLGWFVAPVLVLRLPDIVRIYNRNKWTRLVLCGAVLGGLAWCMLMVTFHHIMPVAGNIVHISGIGPVVLSGWLVHPKLPSLPSGFWIYTTFVATMGAALLLLQIAATSCSLLANLRRRQTENATSIRTFLLIGCLVYLCPFMVAGYFDRYVLPGVFMMLAMTAMRAGPTRSDLRQPTYLPFLRGVSITMLVVMGLYAVAGTHDYLSWNRARWTLLGRLADQRIPPTQIDGGFEFNGLYLYDPNFISSRNGNSWWVHDDQFIVDFAPHTGYRMVDEMDASGWLPPFRTKVLMLERQKSLH